MQHKLAFLGSKKQGLEVLKLLEKKYKKNIKLVSNASDAPNKDKKIFRNFCKKKKLLYLSLKSAIKVLQHNPEMKGILCRYNILPKKLINDKFRFLNIHNSLLPHYKGVHPIQWSLLNNEKFCGVTFHLCDKNIDAGDIIFQKKIKINKNDNVKTLNQKINYITSKYLNIAINKWLKKKCRKQKKFKTKYARRIIPSDHEIKRNYSENYIFNLYKCSFKPAPNLYFYFNKKKYEIKKLFYIKNQKKFKIQCQNKVINNFFNKFYYS